jgi:signal transduction histidine kinase
VRRPALLDQLYVRLAIALVALFAALGVSFALILANFESMYQEEMTQRANAELAPTLAREWRSIGTEKVDAAAFGETLKYVKMVNPGVDIYLLDPRGNVLAQSDPPGALARPAIDVAPLRAFIERSAAIPLRAADPRHPSRTCIFSAAPLGAAEAPLGYVYVVLGPSDGKDADTSGGYVVSLLGAALAASVLFALVAGLVLFRALTGRLRRLTAAVEAFRANGFSAPPQLPPAPRAQDEIARLSQVFGEIGDRMVAQLERLRSIDQSRRTAVLNASHDLRTPLAALRGYLQTLLMKHDSLPDTQKRQYLEVANRHAERLSRLVEQMFELAKLDAPEAEPKRELFSLAELANDIGQKYRLAAEGRGVTLTVDADPAAPALFADIAMVERLVENLLENALKFTPAGGRVRLAVEGAGDATVLRVEDTGCGIAQEHLPHVFERFYRAAETSRDGSSGLGLAIVKRVAELHGAVLGIRSTVKLGTCIEARFGGAGAT